MNAALQQYIDLYEAHQAILCHAAPQVLNEARAKALQELKAHGLPTSRQERYKYTDVAALLEPDYGLNLQRLAGKQQVAACAVPGLKALTRYVAGDVMLPTSSQVPSTCEGIEVMSLHEAQQVYPDLLQQHYNRLASEQPDALTALNTLLVQDGLFIYVKRNASPALPLQIVNTAQTNTPAMHNRRLLILCEAHASATLLLCDHCTTRSQTLTTEVSEISLGEGAQLSIYSVEETNSQCSRYHNIYATQQAESRLNLCDVTLRAGTSRTMANVSLKGEGAQTFMAGAIVASEAQHIDNNLLIAHHAPACQSEMLYKSVLNQESTAAFAGKVYVAPGAQQTISQQTSANLCVSPNAHAYTQPMLEIYADDVKCNHGATVGKLDESALFYMRQRGISEAEARLLLQHAFVSEVISHIDIPALRDRLTSLIDMRFRGDDDVHCAGCGLCGK